MFYGIVALESISDHAGGWCDAVVGDLGAKRRDPGLVPDGASCARGMVSGGIGKANEMMIKR